MPLRNPFRRPSPAPLDPSFGLLVGDLTGPIARIDSVGTIATLDGSWRLEWGVRAGAEWRVAAQERAVRQSRVDDTPVFETLLRVPGGDVIQRVGVVNDGTGRAVVIEYENASPDAVVVATAGVAPGALRTGEAGVELDGDPWIVPARAGAATVADDIWNAVAADPTGTEASGRGASAVLTPLPHRQTVTVTVVIDGDRPEREVTPVEIAAGWRTVTSRALDLDVPDPDLTGAWRRVVCDLILAAGDDDPVTAGEAAWWLDLAGLHDEADRGRLAVLRAADSGRLDAEAAVVALRALAGREIRTGEPSALAEVAGPLATLAGDRLDRVTVGLVARALERSAPDAAADARRVLDVAVLADREPGSPVAAGAARVLGHLFADADVTGVLSMLPSVPASWHGQPIDVRGMVTGFGRLSFSVRWHGARPAVLWEREGGPEGAELRCEGLDPTWSTIERAGEALLEAP